MREGRGEERGQRRGERAENEPTVDDLSSPILTSFLNKVKAYVDS
jgi:hypothetical protein